MTDANRGQDGNPNGVGYLIALPQTPIIAADREGGDGSDQGTQQDARPCTVERETRQRGSP